MRHELASFVVPRGAGPQPNDEVVEAIHQADDGPREVDVEEARRAYEVALARANERLRSLRDEVVGELGTEVGVIAQPVRDVAMAWVRAG